MTELESKCFKIIASAGIARSAFIEAIQASKANNYDKADQLIKEGNDSFLMAHQIHADFIQRFASGETIETNILLIHTEDLIMSAETLQIMALELIDVYHKLSLTSQ